MKMFVAGALALVALSGAAQGAVIYSANTETGFRYNPAVGTITDNRRVAFDDVNFAAADIGSNTHVEVTRVTIGFRRLANAPATDVSVYWSTFTPVVTAPDTQLDVPYSTIGTVSLPANGAVGLTQLISFGDGSSTLFVAPLATIFTGFGSIAIGMSQTDTSTAQGWRITNGPSPNANVFWQHDPFMTGQPNPEGAFLFSSTTPPNPPATFYIVVEGNFVIPAPGALGVAGLGGIVAMRRRRR